MGRGDKKTRKGKTFLHSYGKTRPRDPEKQKKEAAAAQSKPRGQRGGAQR